MQASSPSKKMDFWAILALVIGSQVGSGVFVLPASLAPFHGYALIGWICSGFGAILLARVFAELVERFPKTGGAHVFVDKAFGRTASFFTGWTYWLISAVSTASVIATAIGYLSPIIGMPSIYAAILYQVILCIIITLLNLQGVYTSGKFETLLAIIKVCTLVLLPACALTLLNSEYISFNTGDELNSLTSITKSCALTFWAFIGLEAATAPAESVDNPKKNIPMAITIGTLTVLILYLVNSTALMGLIPNNELQQSQAPYVLAAQYVFSGNWHQLFAIFAVLVCLSNMNAWFLTNGQIAYGIAKDKLLPKLFTQTNQHGAPTWGIIISAAINIPIIIASADANIANQVATIIELSVTAYLFIYTLCCLALIKVVYEEQKNIVNLPCFYAITASLFCLTLLINSPLMHIVICLLITASGIPIYLNLKQDITPT